MMKTQSHDILLEPHKAQFASAPKQARKAATVEEALAAASELKSQVGKVRELAREHRAALAVVTVALAAVVTLAAGRIDVRHHAASQERRVVGFHNATHELVAEHAGKVGDASTSRSGHTITLARDGRLHILGEMSKALTGARSELGEFAPRIETMKIPTDKIREVIGTGGKVIREIVEKTGAKINIEDDGTVKIASSDGNSIKAAINWIKSIASDPEVGQIYEGTVVKTVDFGAFVNFFGSKDGLVHISQLALGRVAKTTDVVKEGDKVKVKLLGFDDRGKVRLSMRVVDQETGEDLEAKQKAERDAQKAAEAGE